MSDNVENADANDNSEGEVEVKPITLLSEQEIGALKKVHAYLSEFDRVPGSMASSWSEMLDTIAVVVNSLISKLEPEKLDEEIGSDSN